MREYVGNALHKDQSILSRSLEAQLEALIVKPLEMARSEADVDFLKSLPKLIILDGLDECGDLRSHQCVLQVILAAINQHNIPISFLIASRPEQKIREAFDEFTMDLLTVRLVLDDKYLPDDDIRTFLVSRFREIKERHPSRASLPCWPSTPDIERLVRKSSGQFIYASTVIKFIDSHRHWPPERLDIIFGILPPGKTTPFAEIDGLYSHILSAASYNMGKVFDIFTAMLYLRTSRRSTVPFLESFLTYRTGEVYMILSDLHSIISVPSPYQPDMHLQFFHASLADFLSDRSRCGDKFFLGPGVGHRKIATWMMKKITGPESNLLIYSILNLSNPRISGYLGAEFIYHCLKSTPTPEFLSTLGQFDMSHVLYTDVPLGENLMRIFHVVNSDSQIPEFLVWLHRQRCQEWRKDNRLHLYVQNVDIWIRRQLTWVIAIYDGSHLKDAVLATATLVDFPGFRDSYDVIFELFDGHSGHDPDQQRPFDAQQWEIYVKYRQFLSEFLTDRTRSGGLFVGTAHYLQLAIYFWSFLTDEILNPSIFAFREMRHLKAVMLAFPELLSRCPSSVELAILLKATPLNKKPWVIMEWPEKETDEWEALAHRLTQACKAYYKPALKRSPLDRISGHFRHLFGRNQQQDPDAYAEEDEDVNVDVDYWYLIE
ncbi:hypothetical protein M413DRAFT_428225 [Hebeloma cylindrosporum]|uniref:NACHT domain-containing protein n=1 Tax=Hebeloma cylindrosporum TaxID=76867 RepID=A0A0C2Y475_HEBCY|nr:hypothetical protein M413DRAFT_428225 [Hebeloma cylindrosporum h7]